MSKTIALPLIVAGLLSTTMAIAATADRSDRGGRDRSDKFAAWHQEMCADRYARDVGRFAYLETRLALADAQRPAFDNWKSAVLASAKSKEDICSARTKHPDQPSTILDRETHERMMLKARLSALETELPALQALYQTLSPEQKLVFDRPMMGEDRHGRHGGHHDWRGHAPSRGGPPAAG